MPNMLLSVAIFLFVGILSFLLLKNSSNIKKVQAALVTMFYELDTLDRERTVIMSQLVTAVAGNDEECVRRYLQDLQGLHIRLQTILRQGHSSTTVEEEPPSRDRYNTYNPRPPFTNSPAVFPPGPPSAK